MIANSTQLMQTIVSSRHPEIRPHSIWTKCVIDGLIKVAKVFRFVQPQVVHASYTDNNVVMGG